MSSCAPSRGGLKRPPATPSSPASAAMNSSSSRRQASSRSAAALADRLLKAVAEDFQIRGQQIPIGLSIGAAIYPSDGGDADDAARQCRCRALSGQGRRPPYGALFRSRDGPAACASATRCSTICARPSPTASSSSHYQPQAKIDGEVFGFEALLRWQHPKHGLVPPEHLHPARRAERHDRRDRRMDAAPGLPRGRVLDFAVADRRQSFARAIPLRGFGRLSFIRSCSKPANPGPAGAGDHRRRAHQRSPARAVHPAAAEAARRQDRHGRFRHRLRVAVVAAIVPVRQDQDRPDLRLGRRSQRPVRRRSCAP